MAFAGAFLGIGANVDADFTTHVVWDLNWPLSCKTQCTVRVCGNIFLVRELRVVLLVDGSVVEGMG